MRNWPIAAEDNFFSKKYDFLIFQNTAATFHGWGAQKHFCTKNFSNRFIFERDIQKK